MFAWRTPYFVLHRTKHIYAHVRFWESPQEFIEFASWLVERDERLESDRIRSFQGSLARERASASRRREWTCKSCGTCTSRVRCALLLPWNCWMIKQLYFYVQGKIRNVVKRARVAFFDVEVACLDRGIPAASPDSRICRSFDYARRFEGGGSALWDVQKIVPD